MDETWKNLSEYSLRALSTDSRAWVLAIAFAFIVCGIVIYTSPWHRERAVSKRTIQARHREEKDKVQAAMTKGIETQVEVGLLTRKTADFHYKLLRNAGYKEVGPEPTFGRPWYMGPQQVENLSEHLKKLKQEVYLRLINAGVAVHKKLKRSKPGKTQKGSELILASLKRK